MMIEQKKIMDFFSTGVGGIVPENAWITQAELEEVIQRVGVRLDSDYKAAVDRLDFVFCKDLDARQSTDETCELVQDWHDGKDIFSATAMVIVALERFGFSEQGDDSANEVLVRAMLAASVLAEVPNDLPYHNNLHFRKVLLHVMRMVAAHNNKIFNGTTHRLDNADIAKLIISACIHDIGHEGKGNIIDHKYHMAMIEKRSFSYACPYLEAAGIDEKMLADIKVMLITTDVSPLGDPISPVNQLRLAYEYHFGMDEEDAEDEDGEAEISEELAVLMEDSHLCLLCVMLQEADIMNSAGVDYGVMRTESIAVSQEIGLSQSLPADTLLFLETICKGRMLSDAARFLADDNLGAITARVIDDFKSGNKAY